MSTELVTYESKDQIAIITLNRPDKLNALSVELGEELRAAWLRFQAGDDRVAILTSATDRAFSVGADLNRPPEIWRFTPGVGVEVDKPIIAAVDGWCVGGAVVLVQFCDLCVVAESAKFSYPEAKVGVSGGLITSLAARIPHKIAMEFVLVADEMSAQRAYEVGMVNKVVPADQLLDAAMEYAVKLRENAPMVLSLLKRFVAEVIDRGPSELAGIARRDTEALLASEDLAEGKASFAEKRKPKFQGR
ncbi:MAG: enoyl-CoA hydratase-related protein [Alphaproteobacteria bacterium]|jgi:enoyl-CoA hydratase/carnithine racemase|nr:enoyl-CoA hydratase-related protein [Alphaproteobacteria bacterium]MDP6568175.1 enoyl-CoA hydratase-related protein [Alphaproteobacteria bacterium]MDP6815948.1 enoyl-CoA hydratase-related protein [Alphaproteobacteria bacterium]